MVTLVPTNSHGTASGSADMQRRATLGRYRLRVFRHLTSIDERHRQIGDHQIERGGAGLDESQRGLAIRSLFDVKVFGLAPYQMGP